jgi:competence protein ComEC
LLKSQKQKPVLYLLLPILIIYFQSIDLWFFSWLIGIWQLLLIFKAKILCEVIFILSTLLASHLANQHLKQPRALTEININYPVHYSKHFERHSQIYTESENLKIRLDGPLELDCKSNSIAYPEDISQHPPSKFDLSLGVQVLLRYKKISCKNYDRPLSTVEKIKSYSAKTWLLHTDQSVQSLLSATLIGNRDDLSKEIISQFRSSGLAHLLAISGFHFALIAFIVQIIVSIFPIKPHLKLLICLAILSLYPILTGFSPSIMRAWIFYVFYVLSQIFQLRKDSMNTYLLSMAISLIYAPNQIRQIGFMLSYCAVFPLLIFPLNNNGKNPLLNWFSTSIKISFWTWLYTLIPIAFFFEIIQISGFISNLIAIPLISLFMISGILCLIFSPLYEIASIFGSSAKLIYELMNWLIVKFEEINSFQFAVLPPSQATCFFGLLALFFFAYAFKYKTANTWALICLLLSSTGFFTASIRHPASLRLFVFDVGQGDSIALSWPDGYTILNDTGPAFRQRSALKHRVWPEIKQNHLQVKHLWLSHPDFDHASGIDDALTIFKPLKIGFPKAINQLKHKVWQNHLHTFSQNQTPIYLLAAGQRWKKEDTQIQILYPYNEQSCRNSNACSLAFEIKHRNISIILTGDLEYPEELELTTRVETAHILKIGHHGSAKAASEELLSILKPKIALNSSGKNNRYQHPNKQVLKRLEERNISFWDTQNQGTIQIHFFDDYLIITSSTMLKEKFSFFYEIRHFFSLPNQIEGKTIAYSELKSQ